MSLGKKLAENAELAADIMARYLKGEKIDAGLMRMAILSTEQFSKLGGREYLTMFDPIPDPSEEDAVRFFTDTLVRLISEGKVKIAARNTGESIGNGDLIGFYDPQYLYLFPPKIYGELQKTGHFAYSRNMFYKILCNCKVLQPSQAGDNTISVKFKEKCCRVIKIIDREIYNAVTAMPSEEKGEGI